MFLKHKAMGIGLILSLILTALYLSQAGTMGALVVAQSSAGVIRVAPAGNDAEGCGAATSPCKTIQYAVNAANSGDAILVAGSQGGTTYTYSPDTDVCKSRLGTTGAICFVDKKLTILGGYTSDNWSASDPVQNLTIIDGENQYRGILVLQFRYTASLQIEGFTVRNGRAGGIPSRSGDDRIFAFGGGMFVDSGQASLQKMVFENNYAVGEDTDSAYGGAAGGGGLAIRSGSSESTLTHVVFTGNQAMGGAGPDRGGFAIGGGLYTFNSVVSASYITFTNNIATGGSTNGGGSSGGEFADAQGGAAAFQIGSDVTLELANVMSNSAVGGAAPNGNAGGAFGGGLFAEESTLAVSDSGLFANHAQGGDGINNDAPVSGTGFGQGGGLAAINSNIILDRTTVISNTARGGAGVTYMGSGGGGGLAVTRISGDTSVQITNSIIADNLAAMGRGTNNSVSGGAGGLWLQGTDADVVHTTLVRNRLSTSPMQGQAIAMLSFGTPTPTTVDFLYSIIAEHTNDFGAAALHVQPNNIVNLNRGLFADNSNDHNADGFPGPAGAFNGLGTMISGSADFVSPGAPDYDYHIQKTSAAVDQATGSVTTEDIDGEPRPYNSVSDIGADEYTPAAPDLSTSSKWSTPGVLHTANSASHLVTYTIRLANTGTGNAATVTMTDTIPSSVGSATLIYPNGIVDSGPNCTGGTCTYDRGVGSIYWTGAIPGGETVEVTYTVLVTVPVGYADTVVINNTADYSYSDEEGQSGGGALLASTILNPRQVYLPLALK